MDKCTAAIFSVHLSLQAYKPYQQRSTLSFPCPFVVGEINTDKRQQKYGQEIQYIHKRDTGKEKNEINYYPPPPIKY
jgi:hypothetical protein